MSGLSVTGFDDVSHCIESMTTVMLNSSSFAIANSMIPSDIQSLDLTQTTDQINSEADVYHHSIEFAVGAERVLSVEDCSDESFNESVHNVSIASNHLNDGSGGSVSTRLRRRKASQPQRLVYCDLDYNLNDDRNANNNNQNADNCLQPIGTNEDYKQSSVDEGIGMSSLEDSMQESNGEEDEDEEDVDEEEDETKEGKDKERVKQKKPSKGFECEICGSLWNSQTRLKSHYRTHGAAKHLKCDICGKLFGWEYSLKMHMVAHSEDNPNKCPHCGLKLFNKTALNNHIKRIHDNPDRPFECSICCKRFISKSELNQHIQIHNESKNFMCEHCGKTFRSKSYLERHYKTHSGVKPFKCEFCGKMLSDKTGFTAHVRSHKGERPFQCDLCGKKYTIKRHLTSHMMIHSDVRPFECDQCGKTFRSRTNFRMHKDSHLGVKRWECRFCQRTFLSQGNMAKHVRRHIGDRKHKCDVCGKAFIEKQELKNHSKMHSNNGTSKWTKMSSADNETGVPDERELDKQMLPQMTASDVSTVSSTESPNSDSNVESNINDIKESLINGTIAIGPEPEADLNVDLSSLGAHSSLISLTTPLSITLPSLGQNLLPLTANGHSFSSLNTSHSYQNIETTVSAIDMNASQLSFCDFQRSDSTNKNFFATNVLTSSRSPTDEMSHTFFSGGQTPLISIPCQTNTYLMESQNNYQTIHCSLCSEVFVATNSLRQHLIDFHRVETEKVVAMMY